MSTLEQTKTYGLAEKQSLTELSRTRLNSATPHQAPQRERVSSASRPASARPAKRNDSPPKRWTDLLQPDRNMAVPQLMMILEPKVVWERVVSRCEAIGGKQVDSSATVGEFLSGWHKGGRNAHGLYEGSYWELIGDCDEMIEMLKKLANAPALLEEPALELPASAHLPLWEDFKPDIQPLPSAPELPTLKLPPYRKPILDNTLPFIEPKLLAVPDVPPAPHQEPTPVFFPPAPETVEKFVPEEYVEPQPPIIPAPPVAPTFKHPAHGHDWSGDRPYVIATPEFKAPSMVNVPSFQHPPKNLPRPPMDLDLKLDRPDLDLNPVPKVELAWEGGVDPEPNYSNLSSRQSSRPASAQPARANSRPASAVATQLPPSRPASAHPPAPPPVSESPPRSPPRPSPPRSPSPHSPPRSRAISRESSISDAGKPRLWMNFEKPFAELPPLFIPPEPKLGDVNGSEPMLDDFLPKDLEALPELVLPREKEVPQWSPPILNLPSWRPPCEPRPIGFLRGTAPVVIIDVSGTMNPVHQGRFREMQQCAQELLAPNGELASSAAKFDVIAFSSGAWSWSVSHSQKMDLLSSSQTYYTGRQVGSRPVSARSRPTSARPTNAQATVVSKAKLLPTEPELLMDAQRWIENWPGAGHGTTSMLSALMKADEHWESDSWLVLSDGLAHDPGQCIEFIERRMREGFPVPNIHCIGFFPKNTPENHEGRRYLKAIAQMTGGSYQEYDPKLYKIYQEGEGFVKFDPSTESLEDRAEREWAQVQLRAERMKNVRLGIIERIEVTMARVKAMHHQTRVLAKAREFEEAMEYLKRNHDAVSDEIKATNAQAKEVAEAIHRETCAVVKERNRGKTEAARQEYEVAHQAWYRAYEEALSRWQEEKTLLEAQRAEALIALNRVSTTGHSSRTSSRPQSASTRPSSSRPRSAAKESSAPPVASDAMDGGSGHTLTRVDEGESSSTGPSMEPAPPSFPRPSSGSRRPTSARPVSARPSLPPHQEDVETVVQQEAVVDEDQAFIQEDDEGEEGEPSVTIVEEDQEVLRQLAPVEVVKALDDSNSAALASIKQEWSNLVKESEESNARKIQMLEKHKDAIDKYRKEVAASYAEAFAREVTWAALNSAANSLALSRAQSDYDAEVKRVELENARVAALHKKEVESKHAQEKAHKEALEKWNVKKEALNEQHKATIQYARTCHAENVERALKSWQIRKAEIEEMNAGRLKDAEERHAQALAEVRELNLKHKQAHDDIVRTKKAILADNEKRMAEAKVLHQHQQEQLQVDNAERLVAAELQHKQLCERLMVEHEAAKEAGARDHEHLRSFLHQQNEQAARDAMEAFKEAIQEAQEEHEELIRAIHLQHEEDMVSVRAHNEAIMPQVQIARIAQAELGRVQAFAEHIKLCAKKLAVGVNFMANTPSLDRVVEMSALTEALEKAFPELKPEEYPWPNHERRLEPGTGWVETPPVRPMATKDVSLEIAKMVKERMSSLEYKKAQRPRSAHPSSLTSRGSGAPLVPTLPASFQDLKGKMQATVTVTRPPPSSRPQSAFVSSRKEPAASHLPARLKVKLSDMHQVIARAAMLNKAAESKFTGTVIIKDDY